MNKISFDSITDCETINFHKDVLILSGKHPYIVKKDGTLLARHKTIRNAYNMAMLPQDNVLMDGSVDRGYHYISLENGKILWSCPQKGKRSITPNQFAVTSDGQAIFYVYSINEILYVDYIVPDQKYCHTYAIPSASRLTHHCYCDGAGKLCMLQSYLIEDESHDPFDVNYPRPVRCYGVVQWSPNQTTPVWKYHAAEQPENEVYPIACDNQYVLFSNLKVRSFLNGDEFALIENIHEIKNKLGPFRVTAYDSNRQLITLVFTSSWSTMIIDCCARKIVAYYAQDFMRSGQGCLIDDEFWVGTSEGIKIYPFPHMDPLPRRL